MNSKGFTFLELLTAILIFALGALVLAGTQVLSTKGTAFNQEATRAASMAQNKIEELKEGNFDSIVDGRSTEKGMLVSWTVANNGTLPDRTKEVTVTVSWASKNISISTIIGE